MKDHKPFMALLRNLRFIAAKTEATTDMGLPLEDISFTQQHEMESSEWQKETESIAEQMRMHMREVDPSRESGNDDDIELADTNESSIMQRFESLGYYALNPDEKLLLDSIQVYSAMNGSIKHLSTTTNPLAPLSPQRLDENSTKDTAVESTFEKRREYIDVDTIQAPQVQRDKENIVLPPTNYSRPKTSRGTKSPPSNTTSSSSLTYQSDPTLGIGSTRSVIKPGVGHPAIVGRGLKFQKEGVRAGGVTGQTKIRFV